MAYVLFALACIAAVLMVAVGIAAVCWYKDVAGALFGIGFGGVTAVILFILMSTDHMSQQQLASCAGLAVVPVGLTLVALCCWLRRLAVVIVRWLLAFGESVQRRFRYARTHRIAV